MATVAICAQRLRRRGMDVQAEDHRIRLLLIADGIDKAALLRQLMEQQGLQGEIRRMDQGRSAVAVARRKGPSNGNPPPDLVLLDISEPDKRNIAVLKQTALGSARLPAPVILLTSPAAEELLYSGDLEFDVSRVFAPTSLACFLQKMQQHSRRRFLRALSVMADLGPILVRLPDSFMPQDQSRTALSA